MDTTGLYTTNSCYDWLEFGKYMILHVKKTWTATVTLKIIIFLWLLQKNKILIKDNLSKKGWRGDKKCIFCNSDETMEHLFVHCSMASGLWVWLARYNNFNLHSHCNNIEELWNLKNCIPYKDENPCETLRGVVLWILWNEHNRLVFQGGTCKSLRTLGGNLIALLKYWSNIRYKDNLDVIYYIIPPNIDLLPMQLGTATSLSLMQLGEED
jgi:zinc-binding in reverse transcriptase